MGLWNSLVLLYLCLFTTVDLRLTLAEEEIPIYQADDNTKQLPQADSVQPATVSASSALATSSNQQPQSTSTQQSPTEKEIPDYRKSCFYAEPELCQIHQTHQPHHRDATACQCRLHPTIPNSWVCCNITHMSMISTCSKTNGWANLHIRNATLRDLDISNYSFQKLGSLAITDGNITRITNSMSRAAYVKCLNFSNNNLSEIFPRAFTSLQNFQVLDISKNNLSRIPNLNAHQNLTVDVSGNKRMLCDSLLDAIFRVSFKFVGPDTSFCLLNQTYNWFNSTDYVTIRQLEHGRRLHTECPTIPGYGNCTCAAEQMVFMTKNEAKPYLMFMVKVDCSNLGLIELPPKLPENTFSLNVSNNNITSIGNHFHSNPSYQSIVKFYADNNKISSMYELEGTKFMEVFQRFCLRKNALHKLPEYLLSNVLDNNEIGRTVYLGGNELQCDCNSAKGLKLWLLERNKDIPDYNQIMCRNMPQRVIDLQEIKLCQSPHDWTDYIYYLIASEIFLLVALIMKVSYDYWIFKTAGYLPWPASKMPKLPCDWLCES